MVEFLRPVVGGSCVLRPGLASSNPSYQVNEKRLLAEKVSTNLMTESNDSLFFISFKGLLNTTEDLQKNL